MGGLGWDGFRIQVGDIGYVVASNCRDGVVGVKACHCCSVVVGIGCDLGSLVTVVVRRAAMGVSIADGEGMSAECLYVARLEIIEAATDGCALGGITVEVGWCQDEEF